MRQQATHPHESAYDALIVGAGTAGLFAAYKVLERHPRLRLLIVDAGLDLDARRHLPANQMIGYGGAGLYLGGRLYLGPATIPVSPPAGTSSNVHPIVEGAAYTARASEVDHLFCALGATSPVREAPSGPLADAVTEAARAGLEYVTSYPARIMTADERILVMRRLHEHLVTAGAHFAFGSRVETIHRHENHFTATLSGSPAGTGETARVSARGLLLAPGRYGAEWLSDTARRLGAQVEPLPTAFGVRLEVPASAYARLTDVNPDPRLQLPVDDDALVKTYATCPGGFVTSVTRYGTLVASGVPLPAPKRTPNTTLAVLVQPGIRGATTGVWGSGETAGRLLNERMPGHLVVQRLEDVRARRETTALGLMTNTLQPTCETAHPAMLYDVYPAAYWRAFEQLSARVEVLAPGSVGDDVLVYGPAEERFWHFPTDDQLQTTVPGLFIAGDGANHSQGVIQAGVAGMTAGGGLAAYLA